MKEGEKISIYNPLKNDFTMEYFNDKNEVKSLTVPAGDFGYFDLPMARLVAKHLADAVYNARGGTSNSETDYQNIYKEIIIEL